MQKLETSNAYSRFLFVNNNDNDNNLEVINDRFT
jgi:hypothetical protein